MLWPFRGLLNDVFEGCPVLFVAAAMHLKWLHPLIERRHWANQFLSLMYKFIFYGNVPAGVLKNETRRRDRGLDKRRCLGDEAHFVCAEKKGGCARVRTKKSRVAKARVRKKAEGEYPPTCGVCLIYVPSRSRAGGVARVCVEV